MALKQDERALLQLVCERGQSYEDLAGLLGISEDEVRDKARSALTELGGADPDTEVGLTDYLLGQADPIGRADAVRYLQQDEATRELAATIVTKLQAIAPGAALPTLPEPRGRKRKAAAVTPGSEPAPAATPSSPAGEPAAAVPAGSPAGGVRTTRQTRLMVGVGAGAVILIFAILAIAGVFSSDDSGDSGVTPEQAAAESQRDITPVKLKAKNGSGVAGQADFGLASDQLYIDLSLDGLNPDLGKDSVYVIWMMLTDNGGYPVSIIAPDENGSVGERYPVPTPVAVSIGSQAQSVQISESNSKELQGDIDDAVKQGAPIVPFSGKALASGKIPLAAGGAAGSNGGGSSGGGTTTPETNPGAGSGG